MTVGVCAFIPVAPFKVQLKSFYLWNPQVSSSQSLHLFALIAGLAHLCLQVHEYLRSKLCSLYENDCIFDKFECCWSGDDRWEGTPPQNYIFYLQTSAPKTTFPIPGPAPPNLHFPSPNQHPKNYISLPWTSTPKPTFPFPEPAPQNYISLPWTGTPNLHFPSPD